jgi:RimJ/RimL family protein N-acetyltransferase
METKRIRLREVKNSDLPTLFTWRNSEKFRFLFHHNENIITYDDFCEEFKMDSFVRKFQFIIEKISNNEPIGLTFVHSFSKISNDCFLNIFLKEDFERKGYGVDTFILFCRFLFDKVAIKKIYTEVFAYNTFSIACMRHCEMLELKDLSKKKLHKGVEYSVLSFVCDSAILQKLKNIEEKISLQSLPN